jgi:hypothetical protein
MPDAVHELLATEAALEKLGARDISAEEAGQLVATSTSRSTTRADVAARRTSAAC